MTLICIGDDVTPGCGKILNDEEIHYYEKRCEECEREWGATIEAWRSGGKNEILDSKFAAPPKLN